MISIPGNLAEWRALATRRNILFALGVLAAGWIVVMALLPEAAPAETALVERGRFEQVVEEDGVTSIRERYTVLSPVSGVLERVQLHAGDSVGTGAVLARVRWDTLRPIRAPAAGQVLRVHREDAGPIEMGQPIMDVGNTASLEIHVDVLSTDAVNIRAGAPVTVERWGGPRPLEARVRSVEPAAATTLSALGVEEQRVRVIVDILSPHEEWSTLGDNFRVECRIVVFATDDAITVPTGALFRRGEGWALFAVRDGRAVETEVELIRRGPVESMVGAGVEPGDEVVLYPADTVTDGVRIDRIEDAR